MTDHHSTYRARAAQCIEMASRAQTEEVKTQLLQLAKKWQDMAVEAEALAMAVQNGDRRKK